MSDDANQAEAATRSGEEVFVFGSDGLILAMRVDVLDYFNEIAQRPMCDPGAVTDKS